MTSEATSVTTAPTAETDTPVTGSEPHEDGATRRSGGWLSGRRVLQVAALLICVQLIVRGWVAARGDLWQDDLIVTGLSGRMPLLSKEFLLYNHDGHFMPAGFLLTGAFTRLAPLEWWPMLIALVLMQALTSLAVLRLLRLLLGDRPALLVPLLLYLFSPLTLPAFAWWIAAVNAVPLQAGLAWVAGDAIKLLRTGRIRYAVTGTVAFAVALSFFEKSLVIPLVAFAVVALLRRAAGDSTPILSAARRGAKLWVGLVVVVGIWVVVYRSVVGSPAIGAEASGTVHHAVDLVGNGLVFGMIPALFGGPVVWAEFGLFALPPHGVVIASCIAAALIIAWSLWHRRGSGVVWWLVAAYAAINAAAMIMGRLTPWTPDLLSLSLRYYADSTLVVALALALVIHAPARTDRPWLPTPPSGGLPVTAATAAVVFLAASLWSTVAFTRIWEDSPTRAYLDTARATLAESTDVPLLEQAVPDPIVWALAHPHNLASQVFSPLEERPEFASTTTELRSLDESGHMIGGRVEALRWITEGPLAGCGHAVTAERTTHVPLDGPLVALPWTVQLNYLAGEDGVLEVSLDDEWLDVPVRKGPNTVYLRIIGGGDSLRVKSQTPGLAVCLDSGVVGHMQPARSR